MSIKKFLLEPCSFNYFIIFILLFSNVAVIDHFVNPLSKLFVLWGVIIIINGILNKKYEIDPFTVLLFLFIISVGLSIIFNYKSNLYLNIVMFLFTICFIFVNIIKNDINLCALIKFNNIYIVITCILALFSILTYVLKISFTVNNLYYGYHWNVLYGAFGNPNSGSAVCMFSIPFMVINLKAYAMRKTEVKKIKMIYLFTFCIILIYLFLADSRGALLSLIAFSCIYIILNIVKTNNSKKFIYIALTLLITILMTIFVIKSPLTQIKKLITNTEHVETIVQKPIESSLDKNDSENEAIEDKITNNNSIEDNSDVNHYRKEENISSSRFTLWKAGIKVFMNHPILGVGQANVLPYVKEISEDQSIAVITAGGVHNGYLDLLISSGIIGFTLFGCAILYLLWKVYYIYLKKNGSQIRLLIPMISLVIGVLVNNLVETTMIFAIFITTSIFWQYIGLLNNIESVLEKED